MCKWIFCSLLYAHQVLGGIDFSTGEWSLIGLSIPNYRPLAIQSQYPSFILKDPTLLKQLQTQWVGKLFYEDYCDYHYVLKLYRGQELYKTFKVNLVCGYISEDIFSYTFDPEWLIRYLPYTTRIVYSRVWFRRWESIKRAIQSLAQAKDVYFYEDPKPYLYEGKFVLAVDNQHWQVNRDSLYKVVQKQVLDAFPEGKAYVVPYFFFLDDKFRINFRFLVYCDKVDFQAARLQGVTVPWQPHLLPGEEKMLIIMGVNKERFWYFVRKWQQQIGGTPSPQAP